MKVIALVSGGKDSCFNMFLCQEHGHEIIALANLLPKEDSVEELDSFCFQTVGHSVVASYASCCGMPLFRRRFAGRAEQKDLAYTETAGDEVEDLFCLLAAAKRRMPEIEAVSSGAIASDYQRLRVEDVCSRLGLTSLAYMWHQPQQKLLRRMCESGIEAVLIKVAALGLDPRKHLGRTLAEMEPRLNELCEMYDVNVCGEGGEYETLTLDCPLFTKARIRLEETEVVAFSERDASQGGMLKIRKYSLEPKGGASSVGESPVVDVTGEGPPSCPPRAPRPVPSGPLQARARFTCRGASCCTLSCELQLAPQGDAVQAATSALSEVGRLLAEEGMSWSDALFVSLYLHSMDLFGEVNLAYNKEVVRMCPPARACVELPLAQDTCLQLDVLVRSSPRRCGSTRRTLHVQSISEWAPPCIGPYSQGVAQDGLVFMAGQISLDPPSMKIVQGGIRAEVRQALQNCEAAAIALQTSLRGGLVSLTTFVSSEATANSGKVIEEEVQEFLQFTNNALNDEDSSAFTSTIWRLDSYIRPPCWESAPWVPVKLYLQVSRLPKGALVEFLPFAVQDENGLRSSLSSQTEHTEKWSVQFVTSASKFLTGRAFLAFQDRQDSQFLTTAWLSETACEFSVLLIRVLGESCLSLNDVAVLKLYYTQVFASAAENLAEGVSSVLQAKLDGCLGGFSVNLVPVLKVGHTPDMSDTLALEFLAVKNPTF